MSVYQKPVRWSEPRNKLFAHQVGFTSPPHDFDAAPSDFLRISPTTVGVHGRMLHVPNYGHELTQRAKNFHLLEEFVECMANNGANVTGQVGSNWVHCNGTTPDDIYQFCQRVSDTYETPFHMAGYCLVEGLREIGAEKIALNSVYYWPDWRDGLARFLKQAGFDLVYTGNFVDQGFYETQQQVNDLNWIFPGEMGVESVQRCAELAGDVDAIVINGMPNFRASNGQPQRPISLVNEMELAVTIPIVASDIALYWRMFKTLGIAPEGDHGKLMNCLN